MRKKFFFLGILLGVCLASPAQFYSARTNLIGLATGNINLEGSIDAEPPMVASSTGPVQSLRL